MTTNWTITPLCLGEFHGFPKAVFTYGRNFGQQMVAPILAYLLRSGSETILVDTGPSDPEQETGRLHPGFVRSADQATDAALRRAGVAPEQIRTVIFTHLHWDHCYNLELFPKARFLVQAEEVRHAVDPLLTQKPTYEVGYTGVVPPWLAVFDRLERVRGEAEVAPGIRLIPLPGHTPGIQGVLVQTTAGPHLIAADALPLYENLGPAGGDPVPPGIHTDVAAAIASIQRMRTLAAVVLPGHDPAVLEQAVYPVEG